MENLRKELKHFSFLYHQGGVRKILNHTKENIFYDLKHGINTSPWLEKCDFHDTPNLEHGIRYRASATSEIKYGLDQAHKYIGFEDAGFYDLGCGKGKVLCIAHLSYSFKKIIGLDYYQPLLDQAAKNLTHFKIRSYVDLVKADMSAYKDYSEKSVVYLYNPADEVILENVRKNLEETTSETILIYNKPLQREVFKDWELLAEKKESDPDHNTLVLRFQKT